MQDVSGRAKSDGEEGMTQGVARGARGARGESNEGGEYRPTDPGSGAWAQPGRRGRRKLGVR